MTSARTIFLFRNDIAATVADTMHKMMIVHDGDIEAARAETDYRLRMVWKITLAEFEAVN